MDSILYIGYLYICSLSVHTFGHASNTLSNNILTLQMSVTCSAHVPDCDFASDADPGLWAGSQYWRWDDGLRGDPLVPGAWGHSELDALHPDWQDNRSCYIFLPPSLLSSQYRVGLPVLEHCNCLLFVVWKHPNSSYRDAFLSAVACLVLYGSAVFIILSSVHETHLK